MNLIPAKINDKSHNNIYIKNIPRDFANEDLQKLFIKYGEITSALVCRDDKGISKGFAFVCFESPLSAANAIKDLKEKNLAFPGLPPLFATYFVKKEDRLVHEKSSTSFDNNGNSKFIASFTYDPEIVRLVIFNLISFLD
jgi:RNA recognition motif-containing protein